MDSETQPGMLGFDQNIWRGKAAMPLDYLLMPSLGKVHRWIGRRIWGMLTVSWSVSLSIYVPG